MAEVNLLERDCSVCGTRKVLRDFYPRGRGGYDHRCKTCTKLRFELAPNSDSTRDRDNANAWRSTWIRTERGRAYSVAKTNRRRARMRGVFSPNSNERVYEIKTQTQQCYLCGVWMEPGGATVDHVQPLSRGGLHSKENLMPSCLHCNLTKSTRTVEEMMRCG